MREDDDPMVRFWKRYLVSMIVGFPLMLICVAGVAKLTGEGHTASALIGLAGGVILLLVSAFLAVQSLPVESAEMERD